MSTCSEMQQSTRVLKIRTDSPLVLRDEQKLNQEWVTPEGLLRYLKWSLKYIEIQDVAIRISISKEALKTKSTYISYISIYMYSLQNLKFRHLQTATANKKFPLSWLAFVLWQDCVTLFLAIDRIYICHPDWWASVFAGTSI